MTNDKKICFICNGEITEESDLVSRTSEKGNDVSVHHSCLQVAGIMLSDVKLSKAVSFDTSTNTSHGLVIKLYNEGWFSEPRKLSEVVAKTKQMGYNFDNSSIAHDLRNLTRRGVLTRQGKARAYEYLQKKPPLG